jgi:hypothetical protein
MCSDYTNFDSSEKVAKINLEMENYNKLIQKEQQTNWVVRKRKFAEIAESVPPEQQSSVQNSKKQMPPLAKKLKPNHEEQSEMDPLAGVAEPSQPPELAKKPMQPVAPLVDVSQHKLESFFKINAPRP